jgi:hypothetical protein
MSPLKSLEPLMPEIVLRLVSVRISSYALNRLPHIDIGIFDDMAIYLTRERRNEFQG